MRKIPSKAFALDYDGRRVDLTDVARWSHDRIERTLARVKDADPDHLINPDLFIMPRRSSSVMRSILARRIGKLKSFQDPLAALLPDKIRGDERQPLYDLAASAHALSPTPGHFSSHQPDYTLARLHAEFPWMAEPSTLFLRAARHAAASGTGLTLPSTILCGPPGVGKSSYARALAEAFTLPLVHVDVGGAGGAAFDLQGLENGWGSAQAGRLVRTIISSRIVNPLVIVDEIDRAGPAATSQGARHPGLPAALMSIIEPSTSKAWICPYYKTPFDLSRVSVIMTCNSLSGIDQPLLDRCKVIRIPDLTAAQIIDAVPGIAGDRLGEEAVELIQDHLRSLMRRGRRLSLRAVTRMIDGAAAAADAPILQ